MNKYTFLSVLILAVSSTVLVAQKDSKRLTDPQAVPQDLEAFTPSTSFMDRLSDGPISSTPVTVPTRPFAQPMPMSQTGLQVGARDINNRPLLITATDRYMYPMSRSMTDQAIHFVESASDLLGIDQASAAFETYREETDDLGMIHVRMQQVYDGVPVYGGEIILHGRDGKIDMLNGRYLPQPQDLDTAPTLSSEQALATIPRAQASEGADPLNIFDLSPRTQLVVYMKDDKLPQLAYHVTMYHNLIDRWEYFVDAHSGAIMHEHTSICKLHGHHKGDHATHDHGAIAVPETQTTSSSELVDGPVVSTARDLFNRNQLVNVYNVGSSFFMIDASRAMFNSSASTLPNEPVGVIWTIDAFNTSVQNDDFQYDHIVSNTDAFTGQNTGVSAHANGGKAYEYFSNTYGRNAINGSGGNIISLINVSDEDGNSFDNAFWNGQAMFYGNGRTAFEPLARALDVAGHEMSHGVIQATANLTYQGESGALNESFADVFGAMIDRDDWLIGEDVVKLSAFPSGALRNMSDPHNGAATGDFSRGWQPKNVSEQFMGSQNNGGVHINSGIPNHAFYLFAQAVGRDKAEQVYYRALTTYLTKSSQFADARIAVINAATDLYGQAEIDAAANAWSAVGVGAGATSGDYEDDLEANPGQDLVVVTNRTRDRLDLFDGNGNWLTQQAPLSDIGPLSKPSVTDDGSIIIYVGTDNRIYEIAIDWTDGTFSRSVFQSETVWRNAVISKDGRRIAATTTAQDNRVIIYDAVIDDQVDYFLYIPTFTTGVDAGDVLYSDAMEFDVTGQFLLYDAFNRLNGTGGNIEFWDIGLMEVWSNTNDGFTLGNIQKLFTGLQEGESIGNPTFSKNSDYIIAFDYRQETSTGSLYSVLAANLERGDIRRLYDNTVWGYPSYSRQDDKVIHDIDLLGALDLGVLDLATNKIDAVPNSEDIFVQGARWGVWFSNGQRVLTDVTEATPSIGRHLDLVPNPSSGLVTMTISLQADTDGEVIVTDMQGRQVISYQQHFAEGEQVIPLDLSALPIGNYIVTIRTLDGLISEQVVKI